MLSIGYSSCHWCHVMAQESFQDTKTASALNQRFVCIKVDREERPDIDAIYLAAVHCLTGEAGWPLTVFCTPDGKPFYGGTYFPAREGMGKPSFHNVLSSISEAWHDRHDQILRDADDVTAALAIRCEPRPPLVSISLRETDQRVSMVRNALKRISKGFDYRWGGFGTAPKFPQPALLTILTAVAACPPEGLDDTAIIAQQIATLSLASMGAGGIRDHLGGGFARYSTDRRWIVPHFEKLACDQVSLARCYLRHWWWSGEPAWLDIAQETLTYLLIELTSARGGIYSAQDADSGNREGDYYLWSYGELKQLLSHREASEAKLAWGVSRRGNFHGRNVLHRPWSGASSPADAGVLAQNLQLPSHLRTIRDTLYKARSRRPPPDKDEKTITEWNAAAVGCLSEAAMATGESRWLAAAVKTATFLTEHLRREDGRWMRSWHAGSAGHLGTAADYAELVNGFTRLGEASGEAVWTLQGLEVANAMVELFWDYEHMGFFSTGNDAPPLIARPKELADGSSACANAVAATALWRLAALTDNEILRNIADSTLDLLEHTVVTTPAAAGGALSALHFRLVGPIQVVVVGKRTDLVKEAHRKYRPGMVLAWGEPYPSPIWQGKSPGYAYVCRQGSCLPPARSPEELSVQIDTGLPALAGHK